MADRNEAALQAAIKALELAVSPAVDPADPLASEQLRLVIGYLKLMRGRLGHVEARARFEFEHYRVLVQALQADAASVSGDVAGRFELAQALARDAGSPAQRRAATAALASAVSGLVRAVADAPTDLRARVERTVATQSRRWVDAQRAWFAPLGFELRPAELPALDDALDVSRVAP